MNDKLPTNTVSNEETSASDFFSVLDFFKNYSRPATWLTPAHERTLSQITMKKCSINMILHCPYCGVQHIDMPEPDGPCVLCMHPKVDHFTKTGEPGWCCDGCDGYKPWTNPPHRKHLCKPADGGCGRIFQPAEINTNGVQEL